ncbi:MAG: class D beta-lactamase [Cyanobacteriota bacterium]
MASPAALGLSLLLPALVTTAVAAAPFASPAPSAQAPSAQAPSAQAPGAPAGLPPGSSLDGPAPAPAQASRWRQEPAVELLFRRAGKSGTFVLFDPDRGLMRGHDRRRAETRFTPASTFKIANSLIGLSVGAVASVDEVLPYRSNDPPFSPAWEKDMGLRQAMVVSNVPIFQELARRIGLERMRQGVVKLGYGNEQIGTQVDRFWLRGPLAISAVEQTIFLNRLARRQLPFPMPAQRAVAAITVVERGEGWVLHAKTGWQNGPGAGVGWWVGWVEREGRVYPFALNLDLGGRADADLRLSLGRAALKATGVLP